MAVQKTPLSSLKNTANGIAGLDAQARVTSPIRGRVSILDHGADPTGVADCSAALAAAMAVYTQGTGYYISGPEIEFPPGVYRFASEVNLKKTVKLVGAGSGLAGGQSTVLTFPADSRGIIINRYNTMSNGVEGVPTTAADGSILQGLELRGSGTNSSAHGVWMRSRAIVRDCVISGFGGNGLNIVAYAGVAATEPAIEGNANNWHVDNIRCQGNGEWGVFVDGPDVNSGIGIGIDCSSNGSGGIWDSSFLGNTYLACHTAANAEQVAGKNSARNRTAMVFYAGGRYYAGQNATDAQLVATVPGTNSNIWVYQAAASTPSSSHPEWVPSQPEGRYFYADQYRSDGAGANNLFLGCYQEEGYTGSHFSQASLIFGGEMGDVSGGVHLKGGYDGLRFSTPIHTEKLVLSTGLPEQLQLSAPGDHSSGLSAFTFHSVSGDWITQHARLDARVAARYTTNLSTFNGGRASAVGGGHIRFPRGAFMGQRLVDSGTAPPTSGEAGRGDMRINESAAVGQPSYWQCTAAGVNGSTAVWTAGPSL
jgi:hypothetical protein